ncbi:MAG: hypothetical protein HZB14_08045 [Actinobacteria bacterium]|nr:hypothetical protein [Actinomycetota bacterium]
MDSSLSPGSGAPAAEGHSLRRMAVRFSEAYGLILLLTVVTFITFVSLPAGDGWSAVALSVAALTGVMGIVSSAVVPGRARLAALLGAVVVVLAAVSAIFDLDRMLFAAAALVAVLLAACELTILRRVIFSESVSTRTILGAITSYTMLGVLFAFLYLAVVHAGGTPFFTGEQEMARGDLIFFSYTTLTTTGYGNLVPADAIGQSIAMIEMLTGQIFLVTLIAGLVSLWQPTRARFHRDQA